MTTSIERAAEALIPYSSAYTNRHMQARKVFESIDPDELARVLQQATDDGADRTEDYARAVIAHLTKGDKNDE